MSNILFKLSIPCIFILTAAVLLVQTPTYAAADRPNLLIPSADCSAPCFIGITPGVTTVDAALQLLQANPLIQSITLNSFDRYDAQSIEAFVVLPLERESLLLYAEQRIVQGITLSGIHIQLGDIVLLLGQPDQYVLNDTLHGGSITYAAFYPQYNMTVAVDLPKCSVDLSSFWSAQRFVSIGIETAQGYAAQTDYYRTGAQESNDGWARQIQMMKHASCL